jgi:hypothetical protein
MEDAGEGVPARKISDCSNRSVDSGVKMSEVSKDDEFQRKLSDLSEASQNNSEVEEDGREGEGRGGREEAEPVSPALPPVRDRSDSVHDKVDFFNKWILRQQETCLQALVAVRKKRSRLVRTQSEVLMSEPTSLPPRRGSMFPTHPSQWQDTSAT